MRCQDHRDRARSSTQSSHTALLASVLLVAAGLLHAEARTDLDEDRDAVLDAGRRNEVLTPAPKDEVMQAGPRQEILDADPRDEVEDAGLRNETLDAGDRREVP